MKTTLRKAMSWLLVLSMMFSLAAVMAVGVSAALPTVAAPTNHATYGTYIGEAGATAVGITSTGKEITNIQAYYKVTQYNSVTGEPMYATLTLDGNGAMKDFVASGVSTSGPKLGDRPWDTTTVRRATVQSIVVGEGITRIGNAAFWGLQQCLSVQMPSTLLTIGEWSFCRTDALGSVIIPARVTTIENFAFYDSGLLQKAPQSTCLGSPNIINEFFAGNATNANLVNDLDQASRDRLNMKAQGYAGSLVWVYDSITNTLTITNPNGNVATMPVLTGAAPWEVYFPKMTTVLIGDGIANVSAGAFAGATALKTVSLGKDVASIDAGAFVGCRVSTGTKKITQSEYAALPAYKHGDVDLNGDGRIDLSDMVALDQNGDGVITVADKVLVDRNKDGVINDLDKDAIDKNGDGKVNYDDQVGFDTNGDGVMDKWNWEYEPAKDYVMGYEQTLYVTTLDPIMLPAATKTIGANAFNKCDLVSLSTTNKSDFFRVTIDTNNDGVVDATVSTIDTTNTNLSISYNSASTPTTSSGIINNQIQWSYNLATKTLTLTPVGTLTGIAIPDYTSSATAPWASIAGMISSVSIGSGIARVGNYAFADMVSLTSVSFSEGLQYIGEGAFSSTSLYTVTLPASLVEVERYAFSGCARLTSATQKNPNTAIRTPNRELLKILADMPGGTYPDTPSNPSNPSNPSTPSTPSNPSTPSTGNTEVGYLPTGATWTYHKTDKKLVIYGGAIPDYTSTTMPWAAYINEIETIDLLSGVSAVGDYAFYGAKALTTLTLSSGLTEIGKDAFYGCEKLRKIDFPATLTLIDKEAFYGCSALEGAIIRSTALAIDSDAFSQCPSLKKVVYTNIRPTGAGATSIAAVLVPSVANGTDATGTVNWKADRAEGILTLSGNGVQVTSTSGWATELAFADTIVFGDGIKGIGANLLAGNKSIKTVTVGKDVTSIGDSAFENCTALTTVTLPDTLTSIGARAFFGCSGLTEIKLPKELSQVAEYVFAHCTSLTKVTVGQKVVKIGTGAFNNCASLHTIELHNTLSPLTTGIFAGCSKLRTVNFHGTPAQWAALIAGADSEIKSIGTPVYYVTKTIKLVYKGGANNGLVAETLTFSGVEDTPLTVDLPAKLGHYSPESGNATFTTTYKATTEEISYTPTKYQINFRFIDADTNGILPWTVSPILLTFFEMGQIKTGSLASANPSLTEGYDIEDKTIVIYAGDMVEDRVIDVIATKHSYTYTIEYVNDVTNKVFKTEEKTVKHGADVSLYPSEVKGYTVKEYKEHTLENVTANGQKISIRYVPQKATLTIKYVGADGKEKAPYVAEYMYGQEVSVASPTEFGQTPDKEVVYIEQYGGETEITVTYSWKFYTVRICFVEKDSDGHKIYPDYEMQVQHGGSFRYDFGADASREELAYEPIERVVEYPVVASDIEKVMLFAPKKYTLTVVYVDEDGEVVKQDTEVRGAGEEFVLESKEFRGYEPTEEMTITMGCEDQTIEIELVDAGLGVWGIILIIAIILVVLVGGGLVFYFIYMKKS